MNEIINPSSQENREDTLGKEIIHEQYSIPCIVDLYDLLNSESSSKSREQIIKDAKNNLDNLFSVMENSSPVSLNTFCWKLSGSSSEDLKDVQLETLKKHIADEKVTINEYYLKRIESMPDVFPFNHELKTLFATGKEDLNDLEFNYYGRLFNDFLPYWSGSNFDYARCIGIIASKTKGNIEDKKMVIEGYNGSPPLLNINRLKSLIDETSILKDDVLLDNYFIIQNCFDNYLEFRKFLMENEMAASYLVYNFFKKNNLSEFEKKIILISPANIFNFPYFLESPKGEEELKASFSLGRELYDSQDRNDQSFNISLFKLITNTSDTLNIEMSYEFLFKIWENRNVQFDQGFIEEITSILNQKETYFFNEYTDLKDKEEWLLEKHKYKLEEINNFKELKAKIIEKFSKLVKTA